MADAIIRKVSQTIADHSMVRKGDSILLAMSGGPDSTFLADYFHRIKDKDRLSLYAFHLDHMTRKGESRQDAQFVKELCNRLGIKLHCRTIDALHWCRQHGYSFQEGARELRKRFLIEHAAKHGINRIATGHHADDNVETFLIHLLRGAGAGGLASIRPVEGFFIRPLIHIMRSDILGYLQSKKISYCMDRTNLENDYLRNRVRNNLIVLIESKYSSAFRENVLKTIEVLRDEDNFLKNESLSLLRKLDESGQEGLVKIPAASFCGLDLALQRRLLFACVQKAKGDLRDIRFKNIADMVKHACRKGNKRISLGDRVFFLKQYGYLYCFDERIHPRLAKAPGIPVSRFARKIDEREIEDPNNLFHIEEIGLSVSFNIIEKGCFPSQTAKITRQEAYLDYDKIRFPLTVRDWQAGDRFIPLGMTGEKKLHDLFIDLKVERNRRSLIPLFSDNDNIIWVAGLMIDERFKVTEKTKKILYIKTMVKR